MKIAFISDTHGFQPELPDCDILIHAGDFTGRGTVEEIEDALWWFGKSEARHKICIAGNHDFGFQNHNRQEIFGLLSRYFPDVIYLEHNFCEVEGLTIFGSPWVPLFGRWAFMCDRGEMSHKWSVVENVLEQDNKKIDILVSHGPPRGVLDKNIYGESCGSIELLTFVQKTKPRYCVFGHIHEDHGKVELDGTTFLNVCHVNLDYEPTNQAVVIEL